MQESGTRQAQAWLNEDPAVTTWVWTRVELAGAFERRAREGTLTREQRQVTLDRFGVVAATWNEVTDVLSVRARALALLARHPLRASDAAQLAAALLVAGDQPAALTFVSLDDRLRRAAEGEGFRVLGSA